MTNNRKLWTSLFTGAYAIGCIYFFMNYDIEDFYWWMFFLFLGIFTYSSIRLYFSYQKEIKRDKDDVLLNAKEKWDFLYQDVWVLLLVFVCFCLFLGVLNMDEPVSSLCVNIIIFLKVLFDKLVLRNKLIVDNDTIAFSKGGVFSEIKFRLVKGMLFDEDQGRVTINYEKIITPKRNFLSIKFEPLDIDEIEVTKNEVKVLNRRGLFEKDWNDFKEILDQKSKEYDFGLSVVYPI